MTDNKPFCTVPFVKSFVSADGTFRDCCATYPTIVSESDESWEEFWNNNTKFQTFKKELYKNDFPRACEQCKLQEQHQGRSFRTAVNKENPTVDNAYPKDWSIGFGNVCNLACWSCSERSSSTIFKHKRSLNLLPEDFQDPNISFNANWPILKEQILHSYTQHDIVTLTLYGGEPTYNPIVIDFLIYLVESKLSSRTKLEITTNGTRTNNRLMELLDQKNWNNIFVILSIDAVGKKAEWVRHGCKWDDVSANIDFYKKSVHYVEIHCTLSILNIMDLPEVYDLAQDRSIRLVVIPVLKPEYISLANWDGPFPFVDKSEFESREVLGYLDMIGVTPQIGNKDKLCDYIDSLSTVRMPLKDYNPKLFEFLYST
jgi:MoaA/NifB/PqqE/SkfB family radical SAM enzyme